jgi:hypothetical protein
MSDLAKALEATVFQASLVTSSDIWATAQAAHLRRWLMEQDYHIDYSKGDVLVRRPGDAMACIAWQDIAFGTDELAVLAEAVLKVKGENHGSD